MGARQLLRLVAVILAAAVLLPAAPCSAERIASRAEDGGASRASDVARIQDALARSEVAEALAAHGLSAGEVAERLERLSAEDVQRLAGNVDQIQAAGSVPEYVWILLAVFLAVSTLAIIL